MQWPDSTDRNRDDYIQAIIQCRDNLEEGLGKLASMLVEGAYIGWKELFRYLNSRLASPIVIEKSDKDNVPNKVELFCRNKEISEEAKEKLLAEVLSAVESADTSGIVNPGEYLHLSIPLDHNGMCVQIDLYP